MYCPLHCPLSGCERLRPTFAPVLWKCKTAWKVWKVWSKDKKTTTLCTGGRHGGFRRPVPESSSVSAAAAAVPSGLGRLELACKSAEHCISIFLKCISCLAGRWSVIQLGKEVIRMGGSAHSTCVSIISWSGDKSPEKLVSAQWSLLNVQSVVFTSSVGFVDRFAIGHRSIGKSSNGWSHFPTMIRLLWGSLKVSSVSYLNWRHTYLLGWIFSLLKKGNWRSTWIDLYL